VPIAVPLTIHGFCGLPKDNPYGQAPTGMARHAHNKEIALHPEPNPQLFAGAVDELRRIQERHLRLPMGSTWCNEAIEHAKRTLARQQAAMPARPTTDTAAFTGKSIKVTIMLDPAEVADVVSSAAPHLTISVVVGSRTLTGSIKTRTFKRTQAVIHQHGVGAVAVIVQGKLGLGGKLEEAAVIAQRHGINLGHQRRIV
jgi:hypothetical protein